MSEQLLRYGLRNGALVSVEEVSSGKSCGCVCPSCGAGLIAKKGRIKEHHFAHYGSIDCNRGSESALHMMAKKALVQYKKVFVPGEISSIQGEIVQFGNAEEESRVYESFVPDVIFREKECILCVEVLVTHAVDEEKRKKIETEKVPTIEIDLSSLIDSYAEKDVLEAIYSGAHTKWIYNRTIEERKAKQRIKDELCDHLAFLARNICRCPYNNQSVSFLYSTPSCHDCSYFVHECKTAFEDNHYSFRACCYRERNLLKHVVSDFKDVVRINGMILSIGVLIDDAWQIWTGDLNETLAYGGKLIRDPKDNSVVFKKGKTVYELWKKSYSAIIVKRTTYNTAENKVFETVMLIEGKNGEMKRQYGEYNRVIGKYQKRNGVYDDFYPKEYVVWDAGKPIWQLVKAIK